MISPCVRRRRDGATPVPRACSPPPARARPRPPGEYALVVEAVREGYLLHYGAPRVVAGADPDLALLAGDYLYALGLERLAALGDLEAVRELSDLISLAAQVHDGGRPAERRRARREALWLASATAIAAGASSRARRRQGGAAGGVAGGGRGALSRRGRAAAAAAGIGDALERAADAIDFRPDTSSDLAEPADKKRGDDPREAQTRGLLRGRVDDPPDGLRGSAARPPAASPSPRSRCRRSASRSRRSSTRPRRRGRASARPTTSPPTPTARR